ncbi:hypothetical protein GCM10022247_09230 [Allokutzneria multivorans]|uniref:LPXTG cell wall anchor domain-containing protein n=1 Tax=Allokutzneria multivorans TaxID=1142134 RepID=A0ABP7R417_9PSEU
MRSRIARRAARLSTVPAAALVSVLASTEASAQGAQMSLAAPGLSASLVPITAVGLGIGGLLLGIVRRKKTVAVIDPANERREPEMAGTAAPR